VLEMGRRSLRLTKPGDHPEDVSSATTNVKTESPTPAAKDKKKKNKKHKKNKENRLKNKEASAVAMKPEAFQRKREDGSTSLAILTPGDGLVSGTEGDTNTTTLGMMLGRVRAGTATLAGFREDRRNVVKPMYPIYYGGYSSHGPTHDSTFANLTQRESVMVGPYFDFRNLENEELIREVCNVGDYSSTFVDHLIDLFSGKEVKDIVSSNKSDKKIEKSDKDEEIDFDMLKTLEQDGIDMSFMSTLQAAYELRQEQEMKDLSLEEQLELTAELINSLASVQSARLSAPPPTTLSAVTGPGEKESRLAEKVVTNLTSLTGLARPGHVVDMRQVRAAMGVTAPPSPTLYPSLSSTVLEAGGTLANGGLSNGDLGGDGGVTNGVGGEPMECV